MCSLRTGCLVADFCNSTTLSVRTRTLTTGQATDLPPLVPLCASPMVLAKFASPLSIRQTRTKGLGGWTGWLSPRSFPLGVADQATGRYAGLCARHRVMFGTLRFKLWETFDTSDFSNIQQRALFPLREDLLKLPPHSCHCLKEPSPSLLTRGLVGILDYHQSQQTANHKPGVAEVGRRPPLDGGMLPALLGVSRAFRLKSWSKLGTRRSLMLSETWYGLGTIGSRARDNGGWSLTWFPLHHSGGGR